MTYLNKWPPKRVTVNGRFLIYYDTCIFITQKSLVCAKSSFALYYIVEVRFLSNETDDVEQEQRIVVLSEENKSDQETETGKFLHVDLSFTLP